MTTAESKARKHARYYGIRAGIYGLCSAESGWLNDITPKYKPLATEVFASYANKYGGDKTSA